MDILLASDGEGFDLTLKTSGDVCLVNTIRDRLLNDMKVALFTDNHWAGADLLPYELGSDLEKIIRLPVTPEHQTMLNKELNKQLKHIASELQRIPQIGEHSSQQKIQEIKGEVLILDNRKYAIRITMGSQVIQLDDGLRVRE